MEDDSQWQPVAAPDAESWPSSSHLSSSSHPSREPVPPRPPVLVRTEHWARDDELTDTRGVSCPAWCRAVQCVAVWCCPTLLAHPALVPTRPSLAKLHPLVSLCLSDGYWWQISDITVRYHIQAKLNLQTRFCHLLAARQTCSLTTDYGAPAVVQVICMRRATIGTKICQNSKICLAPDVCQLISSHKDRSLSLLFLGIIFYIHLTPGRHWHEKIQNTSNDLYFDLDIDICSGCSHYTRM